MTTSRLGTALFLAASALSVTGCGSGTGDIVPGSMNTGMDAGTMPGNDTAPADSGFDAAPADPGFDATPSDPSFAGLGSDGKPCQLPFASGVNVAWIRFANDIPNPDLITFQALFRNTHSAGGRVARWWFHTDGQTTPGYDRTTGLARTISPAEIADVKSIIDTARGEGMLLTISLWSFDMLKVGPTTYDGGPNPLLIDNTALLTDDTHRQAYIDNVLTPLVNALKGYPGLHSWETFNEPDGMTTQNGWIPIDKRIDVRNVQRTVNWFAAAIHTADPSALVTNGTWEFRANASAGARGNTKGWANYYSDAALRAAGGRDNGTLDYYEVHYYPMSGMDVSPFLNPAATWALDKPIVIGEFYALDQAGVLAADTYTALRAGGYHGAWAWQYEHNDMDNLDTMWPVMQAPMQKLLAAAPDDLSCP